MNSDKPKIRRFQDIIGPPYYLCLGLGFFGVGNTPYEAYCQWLNHKWS